MYEVLQGLSFTIPEGNTVAVVGRPPGNMILQYVII